MKNKSTITLGRAALFIGLVLAYIQNAFAAPGDITTVAGNGTNGFLELELPATQVGVFTPFYLTVAPDGTYYYSSDQDSAIWRVDGQTTVRTKFAGIPGSGFSGDGGPALEAAFDTTAGMALDLDGNLYVADSGNNRIRRIDGETGIVTTIAGDGTLGTSGDGGPASEASLLTPTDLATDPEGNLYVVDMNGLRVRKIDLTTGIISAYAGTGSPGSAGDGGPATSATFSKIMAICFDSEGNLYTVDRTNQNVRKVDVETGIIEKIAGTGASNPPNDGLDALEANFYYPEGIAVDGAGNIFVSDYFHRTIRKIDATTNLVSSIAGDGTSGFSGDGGPATDAQLKTPRQIGILPNGDLLICDENNYRIRMVEGAAELPVFPGTPNSQPTTFRPDATIGPKLARQSGDNIYNGSGAGQTMNLRCKGSRKGTFYFCAESDAVGTSPDKLLISATKGNRYFKTKYTQVGGGNVTASLASGGHVLGNMLPGSKAVFKADIKPRISKGSKRRKYKISTLSTVAGRGDVVQAKVSAKSAK